MDAPGILEWLLDLRLIRVPLARLEEKYPPPDSDDGLAKLKADGLVDGWDDEDGPVVTLTGKTAAAYSLRVSLDGNRWLAPGEKDKNPKAELKWIAGGRAVLESDMKRPPRKGRGRRPDLDWLIDPKSPDPAEQVEAIEACENRAGEIEVDRRNRLIMAEQERYGRRHPCSAPPVKEAFEMPVVILTGIKNWPLPGQRKLSEVPDMPTPGFEGYVGPCYCCKGLELGPAMACLVCDRTGVDGLLPVVRAIPERAVTKREGKKAK